MKKIIILIFAATMLISCIVSPGHRGEGGVVIAPALPVVVELEFPDQLYFYNDYYYHYKDNDWYYSRSKEGQWNHLPRDRHPREVRYKSRQGDQNRDGDTDRNRDKGHDRD
jgi:hypothetical protein